MSYQCEKLADKPITVFTPITGWNWETDLPNANNELKQLWDNEKTPVIHISDFSNLKLDFDGLTKGTANAAFGVQSLFNHPNIKEVVIITTQKALIFAIEQMNSTPSVYQSAPISVAATREEALSYAHAQFS